MIEIVPNLHPIFVHFTVALFSLSALLFLASRIVGRGELAEQWLVSARWSLYFGMGITILTLASGIYAYNTVTHDAPSHAAMSDHRNWALITVLLFTMMTFWSLFRDRKGKELSTLFVVGMLVASGVLASTAWRGGEIVYRYGLGVMSLPQSDEHQHAAESDEHAHGDDVNSVGGTDEQHEAEKRVEPAGLSSAPNPVPAEKDDHYADGHSH